MSNSHHFIFNIGDAIVHRYGRVLFLMKLIFTLHHTSVTSKDDDRSLSDNNIARISLNIGISFKHKVETDTCNLVPLTDHSHLSLF